MWFSLDPSPIYIYIGVSYPTKGCKSKKAKKDTMGLEKTQRPFKKIIKKNLNRILKKWLGDLLPLVVLLQKKIKRKNKKNKKN